MDSLPDWVFSIIAVAVGLSPGLAILYARRIARLIHRVLGPRPEVTGRSEHEPAHGNQLGFPLHEGEGPARTGLLTAAVLGRGLIDG
jgi:hypothetical protein